MLETEEKDLLKLGANKDYKFTLLTSLDKEDWVAYRGLWLAASK